jgi:frataxin-like iron-binding protein CyaY
MISRFQKIQYSSLSSRQKENFNFHKISAVLADYGFSTIRLTDDWNGADFLALHKDGETLKVQLKGRITIAGKYQNKGIWIAAPHEGGWFFYPHDEAIETIESAAPFLNSQSWQQDKLYSWGAPSKALTRALSLYFIEGGASGTH